MGLRTADSSFSSEDFGAALVAALVLQDRQRIPLGDPAVERAFGTILANLRKRAVRAHKEGHNDLAETLFELLDELSPDPSTGAYDAFWALLRRLQPAPLRVPNPLYPALEVHQSPTHAESGLAALSPSLSEIARDSAAYLASAL